MHKPNMNVVVALLNNLVTPLVGGAYAVRKKMDELMETWAEIEPKLDSKFITELTEQERYLAACRALLLAQSGKLFETAALATNPEEESRIQFEVSQMEHFGGVMDAAMWSSVMMRIDDPGSQFDSADVTKGGKVYANKETPNPLEALFSGKQEDEGMTLAEILAASAGFEESGD